MFSGRLMVNSRKKRFKLDDLKFSHLYNEDNKSNSQVFPFGGTNERIGHSIEIRYLLLLLLLFVLIFHDKIIL